MVNEALTDDAARRIERHLDTERRLRERSAVQRRRSDATPPEAWQERHSPTEAVEVTIMHAVELGTDGKAKRITKRREMCRRRIVDARLWAALTQEQQTAATLIDAGFRIATQGMGVKVQSFERGDRGEAGGNDRSAVTMADYIAWAKEAVRTRIDHAAIILVLVEGMALAAVDSARRKRRGYTRDALAVGLNLYCKQQGWPVATTS